MRSAGKNGTESRQPPLYLPAALAAVFFLGAFLLLPGCYVLKQGGVLLGYRNGAVPLEEAGGPDAPEELRRFAARVADIRSFAIRELGLEENRNYTLYVELDRDYLAAVVSASHRDSFRRHEWRFPIVGTVPYKGFFDEEDAREEAEKLKARDLDVWVRRVDAFSTLGWFSDPLYSYMTGYPPHRLAELLIHEGFHATVFLKNRVQFNEELAEFVGREGARLYMEKTFGRESAEYRVMEDAAADADAYIAFVQGLIVRLGELYSGGAGRDEILRRKEEIIRAAQAEFAETYENRFRGGGYRGFARLPVNNAYLELFRLYHDGSAFFRDLYERSGRDLPRFIRAAKTLRGRRGDPKPLLAEALGLGTAP
jgi:predicted aminopeptidase